MAVFTPLSRDEVRALLGHYTLGAMLSYEGISAGIENTNYYVDTERGQFVLTLFERLTSRQLPFYLELMRHLSERGLPVPAPQETRSGSLIEELKGKSCAIVSRVNGRWIEAPTPQQCATIGALLARMHEAARDFAHFQPNLRGLGWWKSTVPQLRPFLDDATFDLLAQEVVQQDTFQRSPAFEALPQGPVHADLFRDNVLWEGDQVRGVIDFYFAGCTLWLFDLAVTMNDWCVYLDDGTWDRPRATALIEAYHAQRPLGELERVHWRTVLRAAALRFWLSRLYDLHVPRTAAVLKPHDPRRFERTLRVRIADDWLPWPR
ncbi:MAG TPA: homoserine kinase [Burkholderiaceae bacterium]|nr:homoserine kinase [Burkholderiaceae bacterium]